jgi:hypothetical protein
MDIRDNLRNIYKLAGLVIEQFAPISGIDFGFNQKSVEWIDGFIERRREEPGLDENTIKGLMNSLGAFLGECLVANANGKWVWVEQQQAIGIAFPGGGFAFPFTKVHKQLVGGRKSGDSISGFFNSILALQAAGEL